MSKAVIITDMPESCSKCKFMYEFYGAKKCQLLNVLKNGGKAIICVDKLNVARKECCPLVSKKEYDKEIRDKAIEELRDKICSHFADWQYSEDDKRIKDIIELASESVEEIAEHMKEVGK